MAKVHKNDNIVRYDLYLNVVADARLIEHLEPYKQARRVSEELRRLCYASLDGFSFVRPAAPQMVSSPAIQQTRSADNHSAPAPGQEADNIKAKLTRSFGMPDCD